MSSEESGSDWDSISENKPPGLSDNDDRSGSKLRSNLQTGQVLKTLTDSNISHPQPSSSQSADINPIPPPKPKTNRLKVSLSSKKSDDGVMTFTDRRRTLDNEQDGDHSSTHGSQMQLATTMSRHSSSSRSDIPVLSDERPPYNFEPVVGRQPGNQSQLIQPTGKASKKSYLPMSEEEGSQSPIPATANWQKMPSPPSIHNDDSGGNNQRIDYPSTTKEPTSKQKIPLAEKQEAIRAKLEVISGAVFMALQIAMDVLLVFGRDLFRFLVRNLMLRIVLTIFKGNRNYCLTTCSRGIFDCLEFNVNIFHYITRSIKLILEPILDIFHRLAQSIALIVQSFRLVEYNAAKVQSSRRSMQHV
ncbi:uncharacterized protein TRIADDRAFT_61647 [Trichoplax adhaerens]|uniref:Uncharacterized protein n=1 Tax=Trichoplax adhaerens TaxID=10228 RepID=B3SBK4_TRIAD|nr:predicted protein [Trichoplax adhaerens]EDV19904.1 predicted protein [Trichoplax adhaerens]|eukprot:XP_002117646.1 predicted protein [Trichoplax adhaerens]